ncbi:helix-turn-helix domain-containing protein [Halobacillus litoralis]|uniref:helix-turn-helix domain-containing protein n=1 Tax=Halobacillus litoralis TaxID=45668 RepID=UPI0013684E8B|nr:XRE family transcriptional regulator [Halobacillus litoralis]MYL39639.1 helix-turn-helix domain-containing protein [Halobacillus litoralis]
MSDHQKHEAEKLARQAGVTLRRLRKGKQLSLQDLADLTSVSKLTLGKIERGEANPSLTVMWKIANGLQIPLSTLLAEEQEIVISRKHEGNKVLSADESLTLESVFSTRGFDAIETHRAFLKPGTEYITDAHQSGVVEYITVMEGRARIQIQDDFYDLETYDAIKFRADQLHGYHNPCEEPAVLYFVMMYT